MKRISVLQIQIRIQMKYLCLCRRLPHTTSTIEVEIRLQMERLQTRTDLLATGHNQWQHQEDPRTRVQMATTTINRNGHRPRRVDLPDPTVALVEGCNLHKNLVPVSLQ